MPFRYLRKTVLQGYNERSLAAATALFEKYIWKTANLEDKSIETDKLADLAVTPAKLSTGQYGGDYIKLSDVKATTVSGGASIAGTQTRDLNTEDSDTGGHCDLAYTLAYDAQTVNFTVGQVVTDGTTAAFGTIVADEDAGVTGTLWLINITGTFGDNNPITDPLGGSATANIPTGVAGKGFYLSAGTYQIESSVPAYSSNRHKAFFYNINDSQNEPNVKGTSEYAYAVNSVSNRSFLRGDFTISSPKVFRVDHYTALGLAIRGLGVETSDGTDEVYTVVELHKVK